MQKGRIVNIMLLTLVVLSSSCKKSDTGCTGVTADCSTVTFSGTIQPLAASKCSSCHDGAFLAYPNMSNLVANGSLENQVIVTENMPSGGITMTCVERAEFECWINAGGPDN